MSKIALSGPAGGTATYTVTAPTGSTDRTVVLPDSNGTILTTATPGVPVNGPAFSASSTVSQGLSAVTLTKITFPTEEFDSASCFNNTAGTVGGIPAYAFLPNVAGYYQVNATMTLRSVGQGSGQIAALRKNGVTIRTVAGDQPVGNYDVNMSMSNTVYLNGTTDYLELWALTGGAGTANGSYAGSFSAFLARSAT